MSQTFLITYCGGHQRPTGRWRRLVRHPPSMAARRRPTHRRALDRIPGKGGHYRRTEMTPRTVVQDRPTDRTATLPCESTRGAQAKLLTPWSFESVARTENPRAPAAPTLWIFANRLYEPHFPYRTNAPPCSCRSWFCRTTPHQARDRSFRRSSRCFP